MKLYVKQKVFSFRDKFFVVDENEREQYYVEGAISFGKKLHVYDNYKNELACVYEKFMSFMPRYYVSQYGEVIAEIVREFSFFKPKYRIENIGWHIEGDIFEHEYSICDDQNCIAKVSKAWFSFGDAYEIDVNEEAGCDPVIALAVVLVIDACLEDNS